MSTDRFLIFILMTIKLPYFTLPEVNKKLKSNELFQHAVGTALHADGFQVFGQSLGVLSVLCHVELIFCDSRQIKLESPHLFLFFLQGFRDCKGAFLSHLPPTSHKGTDTHTHEDKTQTLRCIKSEELTDKIKQ